MSRIFTVFSAGEEPTALISKANHHNALVVDIRTVKRGWDPRWSVENLKIVFGERYTTEIPNSPRSLILVCSASNHDKLQDRQIAQAQELAEKWGFLYHHIEGTQVFRIGTIKDALSVREAAEYLGMELPNFKSALYKAKHLRGHLLGNRRKFSREELDHYNTNIRPFFKVR